MKHTRFAAESAARAQAEAQEERARQPVDRKTVLLKAAYDILKKVKDAPYVESAMEMTAFYDEAECDGFCLMEDIATELDIDTGR